MTQTICIRRFLIDPELGERVGALIKTSLSPGTGGKGRHPV